MAVYKRKYSQYDGPLTPLWSRFLVLPRYALKNVFKSRLVLVFFVACYIPAIVAGSVIYIRHNEVFMQLVQATLADFVAIDGDFFLLWFMGPQVVLTFILTAFVGPGLVAPDLANGALPLYFCRPFSRAEYVLGKASVLIILISALTWIPGLLLMIMHAGYTNWGWLIDNFNLVVAMVASSFLWIAVLSLLSLAVSAWVRWRMLAGAMMFVIFFVLSGFGNSINEMLDTRWGMVIDLARLVTTVMNYLFTGAVERNSIPIWSAFVSLAFLAGICLMLLNRRIRAHEVVR